MVKPSAKQMQRAVILEHYAKSLCVPNYTPSGWFECDIFRVTKAGYFREYEVKITRPDFRADAEKRRDEWRLEQQAETGRTVHVRRPGDVCLFADRRDDGHHTALMVGPKRWQHKMGASIVVEGTLWSAAGWLYGRPRLFMTRRPE